MTLQTLGRVSQVSTELQRLSHKAYLLCHNEADLPDAMAVGSTGTSSDAYTVLKAVGYTAEDKVEKKKTLSTKDKSETTGATAWTSLDQRGPFADASTDYLFVCKDVSSFSLDHPAYKLGACELSNLAMQNPRVLIGRGTDRAAQTGGDNLTDTPLEPLIELNRGNQLPAHDRLYDTDLSRHLADLYDADTALYGKHLDPRMLSFQDPLPT